MKPSTSALRQRFGSTHLALAGLASGILALGLVFAGRAVATLNQPSEAKQDAETSAAHPLVYDATGAMLDAVVFPEEADVAVARPYVYDATGAMLDAVVLPEEVETNVARPLVYDATGAMLDAVVFPEEAEAVAVSGSTYFYDATAAMWEAVPWLRP